MSQVDKPIGLEEGELFVHREAEIETVAKSYHIYQHDIGMTPFRVLVAIGGVDTVKCGILTAHRCFGLLYYYDDGDLCTVDFPSRIS